jgi:hypothetical protein
VLLALDGAFETVKDVYWLVTTE